MQLYFALEGASVMSILLNSTHVSERWAKPADVTELAVVPDSTIQISYHRPVFY